MDKKRKALGKGLGALLPSSESTGSVGGKKTYILCPIENIHPNEYQPRKVFDQEKLEELINSVKEKGIIQPLIVRKSSGMDYELIAGERRWRAAQKAGLKEVPVVIKDVSDKESLEIAIIENIQRADLNPIEEAEGYKRLIDEFSYTQEELAKQVGKDRATVSNHLRVLKLPDEIKKDLSAGAITLGHAKALLSLSSERELLTLGKEILKKGLSVRETEALAKKREQEPTTGKKEEAPKDPNVDNLEHRLASFFGTKTRIIKKGKRGKIEVDFYSLNELDRIIELLGL